MYNFVGVDGGVIVENSDTYAIFDFLYQPIYSPKRNEITCYEILSRVTGQAGERYDSQDFFEKIDDEFIKKMAIYQIKAARSYGFKEKVSININVSCLSDENFVSDIIDIGSNFVALEINELNCFTDSQEIKNNISLLQANGVEIWLDDYHYNNKQANLTLGIILWDVIKIDKSFLFHNDNEPLSVKALNIVLSPFTKKGLIFEGIETSYQAKLIKSIGAGCQGYYFSYPVNWSDSSNKVNEINYGNKFKGIEPEGWVV
ncbi:EAL domain-containing protein [Vibrio sp. SM6]|uniref:EAL domain-containing protein n=1 Tax=Vibrio agarilyticus TaxID=2726741 RepID=A0A7X8TRP8_9VIBR|nr:EAL domain-containing protein [Vibrio agarilyticus]NLS13608.1 EAL domain-containing protein [Vibrio agarilyticus]